MALGLILVVAGGWFLGNYISRPIAMLEEGLLAILNGQSDKRFELDHAELGGLAFRIDQLLNQLMGVEEDNTDDEGRVSKAPTAANFGDALAVDRSGRRCRASGAGAGVDPARLARAGGQYYARLYREYITAKRRSASRSTTSRTPRSGAGSRAWSRTRSRSTASPSATRCRSTAARSSLLAVPV